MAAAPAATLRDRMLAAARANERSAEAGSSRTFNLVFVSQCTFQSQETLLHDVCGWAAVMNHVLPS